MAQRRTDPTPERDRLIERAVKLATTGRGPANFNNTGSGYDLQAHGTVPVTDGDDVLTGHVFQHGLDAWGSKAAYHGKVPNE